MVRRIFSDDNIFNVINKFLILIFAVIVAYPILYIFFASISSGRAVDTGQVIFFPREITFASYSYIAGDMIFWRSWLNSIILTGLGSIFSMLISTTGSYALSRKTMPGVRIFAFMLLFTMWFNAGMIPTFINLSDLNLLNFPGLIIAFGLSPFIVIILRSAFLSVPKEIEEAARIDGASDLKVFALISLPSIKPTIAVTWLMYGMARWNGFFWAMIVLNDETQIPLQVFLRRLIILREQQIEMAEVFAFGDHSFTTIVYAVIVCSIIPILIVFPFMQKYFKRGIMEGGIKG